MEIPAEPLIRPIQIDVADLGRILFNQSVPSKIERADQHLASLSAEMGSLTDPELVRIWPRQNSDATEIGWYLEFRHGEPYPRWASIVGDTIHNLRCALDHTIYALAVHQHRRIPPPKEGSLSFPIAVEGAHWKDAKNRISVLSPERRAAIRAEQPFVTGKQALARLQRISNIDKHRNIPVATAAVSSGKLPNIGPVRGRLLSVVVPQGPILSSDTPAMLLRFSEPNPNFQCPEISISFSFLTHDGAEWVDLEGSLKECRDEVQAVIGRLKPLFG